MTSSNAFGHGLPHNAGLVVSGAARTPLGTSSTVNVTASGGIELMSSGQTVKDGIALPKELPRIGDSDDVVTAPSTLAYAAIRDYAERVGRAHDVYDGDGHADIDALVDKLGGRVHVQDSHESMHVHEKGNFDIFIPSFTSARRGRFTKAHELGHYFLHYRHPARQGEASFRRGGRNLAETQANVFAASLLMPEREFREAVQRHGTDFWKVAQQFDVSPMAAEVRAQVLGLV